jgi:hypothetical protein
VICDRELPSKRSLFRPTTLFVSHSEVGTISIATGVERATCRRDAASSKLEVRRWSMMGLWFEEPMHQCLYTPKVGSRCVADASEETSRAGMPDSLCGVRFFRARIEMYAGIAAEVEHNTSIGFTDQTSRLEQARQNANEANLKCEWSGSKFKRRSTCDRVLFRTVTGGCDTTCFS